ncbi:hypothetical protein GXP67_01370 [Rhodocytophaga rosea]|uniref:DUF1772 domain-containing protein n=1 Tax=Rhodocytophaga rosea TaxID=2704465 RepID=A0A6C0GC03_9BACT|nr:hypothetical protein [Rhodocytophaga rosea]QHT65418.1 hypothetical protein GXP67_01370 [Rhodocytophaga rosea]
MLLLVLNLVVSAVLTGLIWFVQIVHYPLFLKIPATAFKDFQMQHMHTTTQVVSVPMLVELLLSIGLLTATYPGKSTFTHYCVFVCIVIIWLVTFFISVPIHNQLVLLGYNESLIKQLVTTNWLRTFAWTLRTLLLLYILTRYLEFYK